MKKKKTLKLIISIFTLISLLFTPIVVKAGFFDDVINSGDAFVRSGEDQFSTQNNASVKDVTDEIYGILLIIGIVVAVIIGGVLGIAFILQSAEGKAKIKEALIPYVVGCVVVFGAFGIWKAVILFLS